jgi:hypothetical protein
MWQIWTLSVAVSVAQSCTVTQSERALRNADTARLCRCFNTLLGRFVDAVTYSSRGESVRFACVTSLRVEWKQTYILRKPKTLPTQETKQRATKYCRWKIMFIVWTVCDSLSTSPPEPLIPLPFSSNGSRAHRFAPTTVLGSFEYHCHIN